MPTVIARNSRWRRLQWNRPESRTEAGGQGRAVTPEELAQGTERSQSADFHQRQDMNNKCASPVGICAKLPVIGDRPNT